MKSLVAMFDSVESAREAAERLRSVDVPADRRAAIETVLHESREIDFGGLADEADGERQNAAATPMGSAIQPTGALQGAVPDPAVARPDGPSEYVSDTCEKVAEVARGRHREALRAGAVLVVAAWKYRADADAGAQRIADLVVEEPPEPQSGSENRQKLPYRGNTAVDQINRDASLDYSPVASEHGVVDV